MAEEPEKLDEFSTDGPTESQLIPPELPVENTVSDLTAGDPYVPPLPDYNIQDVDPTGIDVVSKYMSNTN